MQRLVMPLPPYVGQGLCTVCFRRTCRGALDECSHFYRWELRGSETCRFLMWSQEPGSGGTSEAENEFSESELQGLVTLSVWRPEEQMEDGDFGSSYPEVSSRGKPGTGGSPPSLLRGFSFALEFPCLSLNLYILFWAGSPGLWPHHSLCTSLPCSESFPGRGCPEGRGQGPRLQSYKWMQGPL